MSPNWFICEVFSDMVPETVAYLMWIFYLDKTTKTSDNDNRNNLPSILRAGRFMFYSWYSTLYVSHSIF